MVTPNTGRNAYAYLYRLGRAAFSRASTSWLGRVDGQVREERVCSLQDCFHQGLHSLLSLVRHDARAPETQVCQLSRSSRLQSLNEAGDSPDADPSLGDGQDAQVRARRPVLDSLVARGGNTGYV